MTEINLTINGETKSFEGEPNTPLLWLLRDALNLVGTKFGCGRGLCGSCTVLMDDTPIRSCLLTAESVAGKSITTIEGLGTSDGLHQVQKAWLDHSVPQCGYCQAGQIMNAVGLLKRNASPSDEEIEQAMQGNLCRCGTYSRIKKAIKSCTTKEQP